MPTDRMSVEEIEELYAHVRSIYLSNTDAYKLTKIIRQLLEERSEDSKRLDWIESAKYRADVKIWTLERQTHLEYRDDGTHCCEDVAISARACLDAARKGEEL